LKRVFAEVEAFKTSGPTEKQVADAKEGFIRDFETNIKTNGYLLQQIALKYQFNEENELGVLFELPAWYGKLTAAGIQEAAKRYLNTQRYVKVTLMPERR
jgi:zinc protease